jgi:hypothetical protein
MGHRGLPASRRFDASYVLTVNIAVAAATNALD